MLFTIVSNAYYGLQQTRILIDLPEVRIEEFIKGKANFKIELEEDRPDSKLRDNLRTWLINALYCELKKEIPEVTVEIIPQLISNYAIHEILKSNKNSNYKVTKEKEVDNYKKQIWITANSETDKLYKHKFKELSHKKAAKSPNELISENIKEVCSKILGQYTEENKEDLKEDQLGKIINYLYSQGRIKIFFNSGVFLNSDSIDPMQAGILGAFVGTLFTIFITFIVSFPIGVMTALCIEELLPKGRFSYFFEINTNNLSSTPPIIFGILGLAFYINFLGLPRSSALTGGLTLAFMMLPILVIATRQAVGMVPLSIKQAAFALGASPIEVIAHHTLPLALPGIVTGTLLGIARVLGESAPLLMIGMVAFIADVPQSIYDPATVFAVQTYIWSISPDVTTLEKTSILILVLLLILFSLNLIAYFIKKLFKKNFN